MSESSVSGPGSPGSTGAADICTETSMSILYVDDDIEDIEIFNEAIKAVDPSIPCNTATSATEALRLLHSCKTLPQYVVLDFNMPGMDGKSCLKEIRQEKKFDQVNIIVYSTNGFPKDIEQIEAMGATFILKASSFDDLCDFIRKLRTK